MKHYENDDDHLGVDPSSHSETAEHHHHSTLHSTVHTAYSRVPDKRTAWNKQRRLYFFRISFSEQVGEKNQKTMSKHALF